MGLLHRPRSIAEALAAVASGGHIIAGGTDVFPALVDRPPPTRLIDITRIPELRGVAAQANGIRIGAATSWSDIAHADLPPAFRMLRQAAREIGAIQIQNRGTIGGNICNASPAADGVPPLLALDAHVELASPRGVRALALDEFLIGARRTQRGADEIMTAIFVPHTHESASSAFVKLGARKYLVISIVMAAALLEVDDHRRISRARIAVGAASAVAQRLRPLEQRLVGQDLAADFGAAIQDEDLAGLSPIDDVRGTAAYRMQAAREIVARALREAAEARHA